jgi:hypothetical protein
MRYPPIDSQSILAKTCQACPIVGPPTERLVTCISSSSTPKLSVSVLVNAFKGTSGRTLRKNRPDHRLSLHAGLFAASAAAGPLAIIKPYIETEAARFSP